MTDGIGVSLCIFGTIFGSVFHNFGNFFVLWGTFDVSPERSTLEPLMILSFLESEGMMGTI